MLENLNKESPHELNTEAARALGDSFEQANCLLRRYNERCGWSHRVQVWRLEDEKVRTFTHQERPGQSLRGVRAWLLHGDPRIVLLVCPTCREDKHFETPMR